MISALLFSLEFWRNVEKTLVYSSVAVIVRLDAAAIRRRVSMTQQAIQDSLVPIHHLNAFHKLSSLLHWSSCMVVKTALCIPSSRKVNDKHALVHNYRAESSVPYHMDKTFQRKALVGIPKGNLFWGMDSGGVSLIHREGKLANLCSSDARTTWDTTNTSVRQIYRMAILVEEQKTNVHFTWLIPISTQ